jgi:malonate transporter and related proteins
MLTVLAATVPVFALVLCGYLGQRVRLVPASAVDGLNAFVYYFALPAMLFRVVSGSPREALFDGWFILTYITGGLLMFWATVFLTRRLHPDGDYKSGLPFGFASNAAHGNVGYLGIALIGEALGPTYLPLAAVVILCDLFVVIGCTVVMLERRQVALQTALDHVRELGRMPLEQERSALAAQSLGMVSGLRVVGKVFWGFSKNPMILGLYLGLVVLLLEIPVPSLFERFLRLLSAAAAPCALFAIGAALGSRKVRLDASVFALIGAKLIIHPLLVALLAYYVFPVAEHKAAIAVLAASLPAASNTFILAQRYDVKTDAIATAIVVGTAASLISVSFVIWMLKLL